MTKTNVQNMFISHKYQSLTTIFLLLFIAVTIGSPENALAQNDPEVKARNFFDEGKYEQALPFFQDLVNLYPKDNKLNYYYVACMAETKNFTEEAELAIQNAYGEDTPAKIFYYQGQFLQANNNFDEAVNLYQRFEKEVKRKDVKETNVAELIELCKQGINPFPKPVIEKPIVEAEAPKPEPEPEPLTIPVELKNNLINFQVTPSIKYLNINQFKESSSIQSFIEGWKLEQKIEEQLAKMSSLRASYDDATGSKKEELASKIIQLEKDSYELNKELNAHFAKAREKEIAYWDNAQPREIQNFATRIHFMEDSIAKANQPKTAEESAKESILRLPKEVVEDILPEETQPASNQVVYKIQIGAYSNTPPEWVQKLYKKLSVIRKIDQYTDDKGVTVYTVGELTSFQDALQMQSQVRVEGVKDAFVAAYKNGERIPVKEARKLTEIGE
ncbi:SPOR domain-containing protein [Sunxiuqinia sp. A32]|uniref:SPOR domain-containing protein n=1 Tax=Sunxiuqinia sp. A32 TaxID=3461496 RepID=UPI00404617B0